MQGKIVFQSDLINDGKQFTGPVLLLWMEEGGESSSGQNPYATLHNWSSSLAGKQALQACSRIPLICCETSTSDYLFQLLSLVNSRKRKGAAWDNTDTVLLKANKACDLVTFMKNYLITDKSCSCIHLVKPWFYEGEEKCAFFFFFLLVSLSCYDSALLGPLERERLSTTEGGWRAMLWREVLCCPVVPLC